MSVSKAAVPKHTQNPRKNLFNLKNIAFIEFLEFFWTKYILFYQNWLNITQDISRNVKIAFNFLPDFNVEWWRHGCLWRFRNIYDTESSRSTFRSLTRLNQANEIDPRAGKWFLERLWKTFFLREVFEGDLWINESEWHWALKALKHRTLKNAKIYLYIFYFGAKSCTFLSPFELLSSTVSSPCSGPSNETAPARSLNIEVRPTCPFCLPHLQPSLAEFVYFLRFLTLLSQ